MMRDMLIKIGILISLWIVCVGIIATIGYVITGSVLVIGYTFLTFSAITRMIVTAINKRVC